MQLSQLSQQYAAADSALVQTQHFLHGQILRVLQESNDMTRCCSADPRLTDYDTLLKNIQDLKFGQPTQVSASAGHPTLALPAAHA